MRNNATYVVYNSSFPNYTHRIAPRINKAILNLFTIMYFTNDPFSLLGNVPASLPADFDLSERSSPLAEFPYPAAALPAAGGVQQESQGKKRRGPKQRPEEEQLESRYRRAERNKFFSRRNRERKKQYILQLEARVEALTSELAVCKARLSEYEAAARRNMYSTFEEFHTEVQARMTIMSERLMMQLATMVQNRQRNLAPVLQSTTEERTRALNLMAGTVVDFTMPLPVRYITDLAEQVEINVKKGAPEEEEVDLGEVSWLRREAKRFLRTVPEVRKSLQGVAVRLRRHVNKYFRSLESINKLTLEMDRYTAGRLVPMLGDERAGIITLWIRILMGGPQLAPIRALMPVPDRDDRDENAKAERVTRM